MRPEYNMSLPCFNVFIVWCVGALKALPSFDYCSSANEQLWLVEGTLYQRILRVAVRFVPIMPKELPIILFHYSADNSYYSQRICPLFYYTF